MTQKKSLFWITLHTVLIIVVLCAWFTGMRIASVHRDSAFSLSFMLPQGQMHSLHFTMGLMLTMIAVAFISYRLLARLISQPLSLSINTSSSSTSPTKSTSNWQRLYHRPLTRLAFIFIISMMVSGHWLYWGGGNTSTVLLWHYYGALGIAVYVLLHTAGYWADGGLYALRHIMMSASKTRAVGVSCVAVAIAIGASCYYWLWQRNDKLTMTSLPISVLMEIDGIASENAWQQTPSTTVHTFGGANFTNNSGATTISVKALHNGIDAYFLVRWQDPTRSLTHLPLLKTEQGWHVQQHGFERFDETQFYEDKFAMLLADNCKVGGARTAHLGPKPLAEHPANWHGKGYHYIDEDQSGIVDLWHWKAVRTNAMVQMDDNLISVPQPLYPGKKRYTAGYTQDAKESGGYVMNWRWFSPNTVVPKRLPKKTEWLAPYQQDHLIDSPTKDTLDWTIPWFSFEPYQAEKDNYPVGTIMPSVMYRSNQFEGDRADVRAKGVWAKGEWTLEIARPLITGSKNDVAISDGLCLWFSAFDHSQIAHTRHAKPIRLRVQP